MSELHNILDDDDTIWLGVFFCLFVVLVKIVSPKSNLYKPKDCINSTQRKFPFWLDRSGQWHFTFDLRTTTTAIDRTCYERSVLE